MVSFPMTLSDPVNVTILTSSTCVPHRMQTQEYFLYADDAKIYKVINQLSDQADLQVTLNTVKNWSDEWLLRLNIDKCKMVSYYRKKSNPLFQFITM